MNIEQMQIAELINDPINARIHSSKNIDAIVASLEKFGQQKPIVIDKNNKVIAGNGTLQAASFLKWKKIDVVVTELEGNEQLAYSIADNRTAELAVWDKDQLAETLAVLQNDNSIEESTTGFLQDEIEKVLSVDLGEQENKEIDTDSFEFAHTCPKCGFQYD